MKKFWVILLSLGLLMAFAMPAAAVDVKFSGSYYAQGWYVDNPSVLNKDNASSAGQVNLGANAFYSQQFRLTTEFQVVEGLKLVTRFDALEKRWGDQSWAGATGETMSRMQMTSGASGSLVAGAKTQENIEFERAYLDFNVPFGKFQVGYMQFLMWGTDFLNTPLSAGGIRYYYNQGPLMVVAAIEKRAEGVGLNGGSSGAATSKIGAANDADKDVYDLGAIYKFSPGEAGLLYQYARSALNKFTYNGTASGTDTANASNNGYLAQLNLINPYTKLTFGNFFFEGEAYYGFGNVRAYDRNGETTKATTATSTSGQGSNVGSMAQDVGISAMGLFLHAKYDVKPAYVGAQFIYMSGDDSQNSDKMTGGAAGLFSANYGFNRALILWNADYGDNMGAMRGNLSTATAVGASSTMNARTGSTYNVNQFMDNVWFYQIYAGIKPMPKMDIKLAWSIANADKKPKNDIGTTGAAGYYTGTTVKEFASSSYGSELDLTASYKIYDNLTYMIGAGYLWTGDYFKGYDANNTVANNYLLSHRLTLNF